MNKAGIAGLTLAMAVVVGILVLQMSATGAADWSAAKATWYAAIAAAIGLPLNAFSLWLIRENLVEARKMAAEATKATTAATEAVEISRRSMQLTEKNASEQLEMAQRSMTSAEEGARAATAVAVAQTRPYLWLETFSGYFRGDLPILFGTVKNSGQTPARNVSINATVFRKEFVYKSGGVAETEIAQIHLGRPIAAINADKTFDWQTWSRESGSLGPEQFIEGLATAIEIRVTISFDDTLGTRWSEKMMFRMYIDSFAMADEKKPYEFIADAYY